jgi:GH15 family glucan-1,4-alpha-glucosidase
VFVRAFGSKSMDAAVLLLPNVGFVDYDDERMVRGPPTRCGRTWARGA